MYQKRWYIDHLWQNIS